MASIDDLNAIKEVDSQDVLGAVERFADQIREGWRIGAATTGLPDGTGVDSIVVLGMGGSGVSGDVAAAVLEPRLLVPFRVVKSYGPLPEWVGRNTLVFAVSYSGNTEETLEALEVAHSRGARIVTVSSGGALADKAREYGLAHVAVPPGQQPRASLGYLTLPILAVLEAVGIAAGLEEEVDEAVAVLSAAAEDCVRTNEGSSNPAKELAQRLVGKVPVVYGGSGLGATAAQRFKCDINEYGKALAFWNYFPELNHNEIVGWTDVTPDAPAQFVLVKLRDPDEHPRIALRFDVTEELIGASFSDIVEVRAEGRSPLARLLYLIYVTQLAAIYIALAKGVDPGPVEVIENLKAELAQR
ncbi:MAG TPA: bifunctional phosphoglucose/phosphomannose isomerase [Actinomycetota bacterium]|nr:bifunctional phosphoglucose/phosphomannose isomerase [Actinomycetota bacterium]